MFFSLVSDEVRVEAYAAPIESQRDIGALT